MIYMIKGIHDNVVLEKKVQTEHNGIYMPKLNDDTYLVLNVGEKVKTVKTGDEVILLNNPKVYKQGPKEYYITNIENIIAVVEAKNE